MSIKKAMMRIINSIAVFISVVVIYLLVITSHSLVTHGVVIFVVCIHLTASGLPLRGLLRALRRMAGIAVFLILFGLWGHPLSWQTFLKALLPAFRLINIFLTARAVCIQLSGPALVKTASVFLFPFRLAGMDNHELADVLVASVNIVTRMLDAPEVRFVYDRDRGWIKSAAVHLVRLAEYAEDQATLYAQGNGRIPDPLTVRPVRFMSYMVYIILIFTAWYYAEYKMYCSI